MRKDKLINELRESGKPDARVVVVIDSHLYDVIEVVSQYNGMEVELKIRSNP